MDECEGRSLKCIMNKSIYPHGCTNAYPHRRDPKHFVTPLLFALEYISVFYIYWSCHRTSVGTENQFFSLVSTLLQSEVETNNRKTELASS